MPRAIRYFLPAMDGTLLTAATTKLFIEVRQKSKMPAVDHCLNTPGTALG
ncbi:MAG: hypothetical protein WBO16_14825 [Gammaproteobacteria bacterium]|jgi:hypothetical protein